LLLKRLRRVGGKVLKWIAVWLADRKKSVVLLDGSGSGWQDVLSRVPQGSVLGPFLFMLFINNLEAQLIMIIKKFADDTKLGHAVSQLADREKLQNCLDKTAKWAAESGMAFNVRNAN
jgi:ribonuclease P/MRP protein subunit RPP40